MFEPHELAECMGEPWYREGYQACERGLLRYKLGFSIAEDEFDKTREMASFSQAVLGSVALWDNPRDELAQKLLIAAADIEAFFATYEQDNSATDRARLHLLSSSVLYDLAGMPGTAASHVKRDGIASNLTDFFSRPLESYWGLISGAIELRSTDESAIKLTPDDQRSWAKLIEEAIGESVAESGPSFQSAEHELPERVAIAFEGINLVLSRFHLPITADLSGAIGKALQTRWGNSSLKVLPRYTSLSQSKLMGIRLPAELWPVQRKAIESGFLDESVSSFGIAAPTGTGKTALTRLLLSDFFDKHPDKKALYVSPSRALSGEIAAELTRSLRNLGTKVLALGGTLTLDDRFSGSPLDADLLVFTPEKADLLMRVEPGLIEDTGLVIVDEAHHIEQGTRGILLEFYLWRLRSILPKKARVVQLSAVAPNIRELVDWVGVAGSYRFAKVDWRASRLRLGQFERSRNGRGLIKFEAGAPYEVFPVGTCPSDRDSNLAELAYRLSERGIVLVLATSPARAEAIALAIAEIFTEAPMPNDVASERLDARIERELYPECPLRESYRKGVVYHHAQLPPRVRFAVEETIRERHVRIVCATTTLAEGVNFPFSTVLVESLVGKNYEISPRTLWNIAGRAGRFGVDSEGHCILFRPSSWENKLTYYRLQDYLSTKLDGIPPVRSALATSIEQLKHAVDSDAIHLDELTSVDLSGVKEKHLRGLINVMRVGYAHASMSGVMSLDEDGAVEFDQALLLAARQLTPESRQFASILARQQRGVIRQSLKHDEELLRIAARIGWSLETQNALLEWLSTRQSWQLEQFGNIVRGGRILHTSSLGYLVGPLASRMSEFEGEKLGGFTSYLAAGWLEGKPLTSIRALSKSGSNKEPMSFGALVRVIYARIQFMLPWALFGVNELILYEARKRGIKVGSGVGDLSVLASEGVPDFDSLRLVLELDIERVDASRLSAAYHRRRPDVDVVGWFRTQQWQTIAGVVRGQDRRRLDPDLRGTWEKLHDDMRP